MKKFVLFVILILFSSCSDILNTNDPEVDRYSIKNIPTKMINANNDFSIKLFQTLNPHGGDSNIFISPVSVSFVLGMTMNGAAGNTYDEMKTTLGFSESDIEKINASYATLINELYNASDGVEFNLANSIWYRQGYKIQEEFKRLNEKYFNAKIKALDFSQATESKEIVNGWVEEQTKERIKNLVTKNDFGAAVMMLVNAIYFNADWKFQFDEGKTDSGYFYIDDDKHSKCEMMSLKSKFKYSLNEDYEALELPYANKNYAMLLIKPKSENINDFVSTFDRKKIDKIINNLDKDSVNVKIPKINLEYEVELKEILMQMGIKDAFSPSAADFSEMYEGISGGIWIGKVRQKSFLKINEKGTEAAAATVVLMDRMGGNSENDEIYINFDNPFIFVIYEKRSNSILFCGKIMNPVE